MHKPPEPEDEPDRKVLADVAEFGWHVVLIQEDEDTPGWAFSIGFQHSLNHPEVVLFGLPLETMHQIINSTGEDIRGGQSFVAGARSDQILEGYDCRFETVRKSWYRPLLGYATWFYRGLEFPALQIVWPDRGGAFPDEPNYSSDLRGRQPLLWNEDPDEAKLTNILGSLS